jgi:tetratricopeptide (TPR) repeat protein
MKRIFICLTILIIFASCKNDKKPVVSAQFTDSLISNYTTPQAIKTNEADLQFWKSRILPGITDYTNTSRYASALINRFYLLGNINDVKCSDSLLKKLAKDYNGKETGPFFSLVGHCILQHRFNEADSLLEIAKAIGIKKYESDATSFDVDFELGRISLSKVDLKSIQNENDYGYQFRKSKMMHYNGELDSSINAMLKAKENAGQNEQLKLAALSNVGDLYIHAGKLDKAYDCFTECIKLNPADLHSIMGIGWIALVKDKNDSLSEKIFQFVASKTESPDPLFKLIAVAEQRGDSALQVKYAKAFEQKVSDSLYGNMYNKYLIQLYTGILNNTVKAEAIAKSELENRSTPQTYAWYAWTLVCNNKKEEAYSIYQKYVSGKPLEGLELYYMGKLMLSLNKGYNAREFFKEAGKNVYDLSPSITKNLAKLSEE